MLDRLESKKILIFILLIVPLVINSVLITIEENEIRELATTKLNNEISERELFQLSYKNNHQAQENSLKNVLSREEIIGKKITFNFRERTNNQIGDLLKFINKNKYNAILNLPIGYQTGEKQSLGVITFDYFKDFDVNRNSFLDISGEHVLQVKLYNIEGTLVSRGIKIVNNEFVTITQCRKDFKSSWEECNPAILEKIKNNYLPKELIDESLDRTLSTGYMVHQIGTKLYFLYLKKEEDKFILKCEDLIPDGTAGQNIQCINLLSDSSRALDTSTFMFDVLEDSYTVYSGSGDVLNISYELKQDYLFNSGIEVESNLYYFYEEYLNTKILGHFSSGSLRTYGDLVPFVEIYKPRDNLRPPNGREMSSFGHLNGREFYGVYPWGELWSRSIDKEESYFEFINNTNSGTYVFPFEADLKDLNSDLYNKVGYDYLSQRIRSIVPCFEGLCFTITNKTKSSIEVSDYNQLSEIFPELNQYGKIYYLPGEKQICTFNDSFLKSLEAIIEESMITLRYQGKTCILNNPNYFDEIEILSPSSLSLENYIYIGNDE